ncbi:hypothetical protein VTK26DRAFT_814 [Humicola hyalothermophila]
MVRAGPHRSQQLVIAHFQLSPQLTTPVHRFPTNVNLCLIIVAPDAPVAPCSPVTLIILVHTHAPFAPPASQRLGLVPAAFTPTLTPPTILCGSSTPISPPLGAQLFLSCFTSPPTLSLQAGFDLTGPLRLLPVH